MSCKRRGFCPACGARRMTETAAHLVDHVIPQVPVRQWVISFPIPLRYLFVSHPDLLSPVLQVINRAISTFLTQQAGLKRTEVQTGDITLIQRFGSAADKIAGNDFEQPKAGPNGVEGRESPESSEYSSALLVPRWRLSHRWRRTGIPARTRAHCRATAGPPHSDHQTDHD